MEQEKYTTQEFEQMVRSQLNSLRESPDAHLWAEIARRQIIENRRLVMRRWFLRGGGTLVLLLFWWMTTGEKEVGENSKTAEISQSVLTKNQGILTSDFSENQKTAASNLPEATHFSSSKNEKSVVAETSKNDFSSSFEKNIDPPILTQIVDFQENKLIINNTSSGQPNEVHGFLKTNILPKMEQDVLAPKINLPTISEKISQPQADVTPTSKLENFAAEHPQSGDWGYKVVVADFLPILKTEKLKSPSISNPSTIQLLEEDPLTQPLKKSHFRIGLAHNEGKILVKHSQNGLTRNVGLMLESHLAKNFWLLTGAEWSFGEYEIPIQNLTDDQKNETLNDYMVNPYTGKQAAKIVSYFDGISFPVGVSMYRRTKMKRLDWFARATVRPVLLQTAEIYLMDDPFKSSIYFSTRNQMVFRPGWLGGQLGFQFRVAGRLRVEAAALAERTMGKLGIENTNYNNLGFRLAAKWGG